MTTAPTGLRMLASAALDRPTPASERYPHVCGVTVSVWDLARQKYRPVRLRDRDCAACPQRPAGRSR